MNRASFVFLTLFLLLATSHRVPAPISEIPEKSTPAPEEEQPAKPKPKKTKGRAAESESRSKSQSSAKVAFTAAPAYQGAARFAGTWSGKISQGLLGHIPTTLTVDPEATSVGLSRNLGGGTRLVTMSGNTISWHTGMVGEITWTLMPNGDGQTAQVTMKGLLVHDTATFRKGSTHR